MQQVLDEGCSTELFDLNSPSRKKKGVNNYREYYNHYYKRMERLSNDCKYITYDYYSQLMSTVHGIGTLIGGFYVSLHNWEWDKDDVSIENNIIQFNWAYFVTDSINMSLEGAYSKQYILHHALSVVGFAVPVFWKMYSIPCVGAMLIGELSSPCLNIRGIMSYQL